MDPGDDPMELDPEAPEDEVPEELSEDQADRVSDGGDPNGNVGSNFEEIGSLMGGLSGNFDEIGSLRQDAGDFAETPTPGANHNSNGAPDPSPQAPERLLMSGSRNNRGLNRIADPSISGPGGSLRSSAGIEGTMPSEQNSDMGEEEDYVLRHEKISADTEVSERLSRKIKANFLFFIRTFKETVQGKEGTAGVTVFPYSTKLTEMVKHKSRVFLVRFDDIYRTIDCTNLAWWISQFPTKILPLLNEALREECRLVGESFDRDGGGASDVHVAIDQFPVTDPLRKLRIDHLNQFVTVEAVVTRRTQVFNKLKEVFYLNYLSMCLHNFSVSLAMDGVDFTVFKNRFSTCARNATK